MYDFFHFDLLFIFTEQSLIAPETEAELENLDQFWFLLLITHQVLIIMFITTGMLT